MIESVWITKRARFGRVIAKRNANGRFSMYIFGSKNYRLKENADLYSDSKKVLNESLRGVMLERAEKVLNEYELGVLTARSYMRFAATGDRAIFEREYFARRSAIWDLFIGCLYDKKQEYVDKLADVIWAVCEETSWVIPAHSVSVKNGYHGRPLPDTFDEHVEVDLFSAATGATLSMVYKYLKDDLGAISDGVIPERMEYELDRRIIKPFVTRECRWTSAFINNWVPWIVSNVLTCAAITVHEPASLRNVITKSVAYLDRFAETYPDDCGCNEGASYWGAAIGTLFDACEILFDISTCADGVFEEGFLKKACRFLPDMCISQENSYFVNFSDCGPSVGYNGDFLRRMGRRTGVTSLVSLGNKFAENRSFGAAQHYYSYRSLKNLFEDDDLSYREESRDTAVYDTLEVCVMHRGDFSFAIKGGHNRESHNHNDVGSFVFYYKKQPVIIDAGNLEYTKQYFGDERYTLWATMSNYHNVPEFSGLGQSFGRMFHSDSFKCEGDSVYVSYASAYPEECRVSLCERSVTVGCGGVEIRDNAVSDGEVVYHYLLKDRPEISGSEAKVGGCVLSFSDGAEVSFDEVELSEMMKTRWESEKLYRLCIKCGGALVTRITGE